MANKFESGSITQEQKKMTKEELWSVLTTIPDTPGSVRKILQKENVEEFMRIMTSVDTIESEWLVYFGDLTETQGEQYLRATGSYDRCSHALTELALKISKEIRPKLVRLIKNEIAGLRNEGIIFLLEAFDKLLYARFHPIKDIPVCTFQWAEDFQRQVITLISSDLIDLEEDPTTEEPVRNWISDFTKLQRERAQMEPRMYFYGEMHHEEKIACKNTFGNIVNSIFLDQAVGYSEKIKDPEEQERVRGENQELLVLVKKEALYKTIPFIDIRYNTIVKDTIPQIVLMRDDPESESQYSTLCAVRINFQNEKLHGFPKFQDNGNGSFCNFGNLPNIVNFVIEPETGDLCFISSGIPISQVMEIDQYLLLQNLILRKLNEFLQSKEPDIDDLFKYSEMEIGERQQAKNTEQEDTSSEANFDNIPLDNTFHTEPLSEVRKPYITETSEQETDFPDESIEESSPFLPKKYRALVMDGISGARADDVLSALRRMMGKETRIEGSHHFFKSERTGSTLPIPRHSRSSKNHISFKLILSNIKMWGYSPVELAVELGVKLPKRILKNS